MTIMAFLTWLLFLRPAGNKTQNSAAKIKKQPRAATHAAAEEESSVVVVLLMVLLCAHTTTLQSV